MALPYRAPLVRGCLYLEWHGHKFIAHKHSFFSKCTQFLSVSTTQFLNQVGLTQFLYENAGSLTCCTWGGVGWPTHGWHTILPDVVGCCCILVFVVTVEGWTELGTDVDAVDGGSGSTFGIIFFWSCKTMLKGVTKICCNLSIELSHKYTNRNISYLMTS